MIKLVLIGTGNVAQQLYRAFTQAGNVEVIQVAGRNKAALASFQNKNSTSSIDRVRSDADIYIIAVNDDAIHTVYEQLSVVGKLVAHTSGSVPLKALSDKHRPAVFYPLQTFSHHREISLKEVPICIEATTTEDLDVLKSVASCITDRVIELSSEKRKQVHLAAVFANNFTNHLYHLAHEILAEANLPFDLLYPLIKETTAKLGEMNPYEAQTGPASRNDEGTLTRHRQLLRKPNHKLLYELLSNSIKEAHAKKL